MIRFPDLALVAIVGVAVALSSAQMALKSANNQRVSTSNAASAPVVVELFTSEGCSSCPAADAVLRDLETMNAVPGVEVIALGQHVDYWNRLGWKDPFSSAQFTARQQRYAHVLGSGSYTPQAIVNGRTELVGSQRAKLTQAIVAAARAPRATVLLSRASPTTVAVQVRDLPATAAEADVLLAFAESGISTHVGRGENTGRTIQHASVVRVLREIGTVGAGSTFTATVPLDLNADWPTGHLRAVVVVQERASRQILGAATLALGSPTN